MIKILFIFLSLLVTSYSHSQGGLEFVENKGQWDNEVLFRSNFIGGSVFLQSNKLTYNLYDLQKIRDVHHHSHEEGEHTEEEEIMINNHAFSVSYVGGDSRAYIPSKKNIQHYNYFSGNDKSKWVSEAKSFSKITGKSIYKNIDVVYYSSTGSKHLKYDFIVHPTGDYKSIKLSYEGLDDIKIKEDQIVLTTSLGDVIEQKPYVYQIINGEKIEVVSEYILKRGIVSFKLGNYNPSYDLIIDPVVVASTYSGSTEEIYGHTATYDDNENIYSAGAGFSPGGLPLALGAYQTSYAGSRETCIHKYNPDGTTLLYGTYLGGSDSDYPHSLFNHQGRLYVLGSTRSNDFPTTNNAFDDTHNGGSDITVTVFSVTGSTLLGSTYLGGASDDGINNISMNYGDTYRGEIVVDGLGNCYVASMSESSSFPTSQGAYQASLGGLQDGVVFKLNPTLSTLMFSTYLGGTSDDAAYGIKVLGNRVYVTGTASSNFLGTGGVFNYSGGQDGFVLALNQTGSFLLYETYFGTSSDDQAFFVEIDLNQDIYVLGQTDGSISSTAGKYTGGNGVFITKFNNTLTSRIYTATTRTMAPVAFLVDDCGFIYASGHAGLGGLTGFDLTPNAVQTSAGGFYLLGLTPDATALSFGSYYGASDSHVDGGTSRFDKKGVVYQATCTDGGFPTLGNAYSTNQNGGDYDVTVFKIDFEINEILAIASPQPDTIGCAPYLATFTNTSGGNKYLWDFGDGSPQVSTKYPSHVYVNPGVYQIRLIAMDSISSCVEPDTAYMTLTVLTPTDTIAVSNDTAICNGFGAQLNASGATNYIWSPALGLNNPNIANPLANPSVTTTYRVIGTSFCVLDTGYVTVVVNGVTTSISNDTLICVGESANLYSTGGVTYNWTPVTGLSDPTIANPIATPLTTTTYTVTITSDQGCVGNEQVTVNVQQGLPIPNVTDDIIKCPDAQVTLSASGGASYQWLSSHSINNSTNSSILVSQNQLTTYYVNLTNVCGTVQDTVVVDIQKPNVITSPNEKVCFNDTLLLWASGAETYQWLPSNKVFSPNSDTTLSFPGEPLTYTVIGTDNIGCKDTGTISITFSTIPTIYAGEDQIINYGESVPLSPTYSPGIVTWDYDQTLACENCIDNTASPDRTTYYTVNLLDEFGCKVSDVVGVLVDGSIYAANSFTPNGDGINDVFYIKGEDIIEYELLIFNRWGDLIFKSNDINEGWDGTFRNVNVKTGTYVWKLKYSDVNTRNQTKFGHVNVLH